MKRENPYKNISGKEVVKSIIVIVVFFIIVFLIVKAATKPKPVATTAQVNDLLTSRGYAVEDLTDEYKGGGSGITENITVKQGKFVYQFFVFESNKYAQRGWDAVTTDMSKHKTTSSIETKGFHGNFIYRTILEKDDYYYLVRVGNTLAYAAGAETDKQEILDIMAELGYID